MLCIVFYLNLRLKYVVKYLFLFFCKYPYIFVDIKKLCGTEHIFIQWIGYGGTTTRTLPAPLTSLIIRDKCQQR